MLISSLSFLKLCQCLWQRDYPFVLISLEPKRLLQTKLENRSQDIHKAYQMIPNVNDSVEINFKIGIAPLLDK